jgi:hypothetical protein
VLIQGVLKYLFSPCVPISTGCLFKPQERLFRVSKCPFSPQVLRSQGCSPGALFRSLGIYSVPMCPFPVPVCPFRSQGCLFSPRVPIQPGAYSSPRGAYSGFPGVHSVPRCLFNRVPIRGPRGAHFRSPSAHFRSPGAPFRFLGVHFRSLGAPFTPERARFSYGGLL